MALLVISCWLVLYSIVPYTYRGVKNDAALLVQLWKDREKWADYYANRERWNAGYEAEKVRYAAEMDRYKALTVLAAALKEGQRPREWDGSLVERAATLQDGKTNEAVAAHYGFYWAADQGDWEAGERYLDRALTLRETLPDQNRAELLLDGAFHAGLTRKNADAARRLLSDAVGVPSGDAEAQEWLRPAVFRAEAALLLAEGKPEEALRMARETLACLADAPPIACAVRCLTEQLIAACEEQTGP